MRFLRREISALFDRKSARFLNMNMRSSLKVPVFESAPMSDARLSSAASHWMVPQLWFIVFISASTVLRHVVFG